MKKFAVILFLAFSVLKANASSQWMWHGAFPWVYSHAENSWWYMKAGADGKFLAWKQGDEKWYSFDEASQAWIVLPGQESEENKAGDTFFTIPDLSLEMLWVEPGTFTMGSPTSESGRWSGETQHEVTLTNGFWLGKHEVTQAQWEKVMGSNPSEFKGANRPVERVSWDDVTSFCEKLTELEREAGRLPAGMAYQLPTEAQWEYACRAGTTTVYSWGDDITASNANYSSSGINQTRDVGQYAANPWGFYDMHGNVWEWCADWYGDYPTGALSNPVGPADGSHRVARGGAWSRSGYDARSAVRDRGWPAGSGNYLGFRLSLRPAYGQDGHQEGQEDAQDDQQVPTANKAGDTFTIPDLSLDMLWVEPGTFTMGSPTSEEGRRSGETQHEVTLTNGFWLGKHEVTQAQWEKVTGSNPSEFKGANRPVERVSWNDVTSFCEKLTELEREAGRLPAGMAYQLPTEAQWEYTCRAGTTTAYSWGDFITASNAKFSGIRQTRDVGQYTANPWGFYDMHGNVWEWTADWYEEYTTGAVSDPVGPAEGSFRVGRGGSWSDSADFARSAIRIRLEPAYGFYILGFRLSLRPASQ